MTSGSLDDCAAVQQSPSLVFVDMELTEQAVSNCSENRVNLAGSRSARGIMPPLACRVRRRFPDR